MAIVLVDGENVRRSLWPNIPRLELEALCADWGREHGHDARVVWEGGESADDAIVRAVTALDGDVWVVTSDRELRGRVERYVDHLIGGGAFARSLRGAG